MADGVGIKTGVDATVLTDDTGEGGHAQIVKLAVSADGSATVIGADSNGLDVDPTRLPGTVADGGELPAVIHIVGGHDGTNAQVLATDSSGILQADVASPLPAGTNNIGDVDVASLPALPTGENSIGKVQVTGEPTVKASDGGGSLTVDDGGLTLSVDDGAGSLTVDGSVSVGNEPTVKLAAGTNAIGKLAANSGVDIGDVDVTTLPALVAGSATIGKVGLTPQTSGGLSLFRSLDLDETEEQIKASAGQLFGWYLYNDGEATVYVKLYNATEANVTVGTTTPVLTIPIPPKSAANVEFTNGIAFSTAITAAAVKGVADNNTEAPAANQVVANFFYA